MKPKRRLLISKIFVVLLILGMVMNVVGIAVSLAFLKYGTAAFNFFMLLFNYFGVKIEWGLQERLKPLIVKEEKNNE